MLRVSGECGEGAGSNLSAVPLRAAVEFDRARKAGATASVVPPGALDRKQTRRTATTQPAHAWLVPEQPSRLARLPYSAAIAKSRRISDVAMSPSLCERALWRRF